MTKEDKNRALREWHAKNPGKHSEYRKRFLAKQPDYDKIRRQLLKVRVMTHYGGQCVCCGEDQIEFLTLDHINGGGTKHRRAVVRGAGNSYYQWVETHGYPTGLQVLCANCNFAKGAKQECPHRLKLTAKNGITD